MQHQKEGCLIMPVILWSK